MLKSLILLVFTTFGLSTAAVGQAPSARLLAAYPEQLAAIEGNELVWKDGTDRKSVV